MIKKLFFILPLFIFSCQNQTKILFDKSKPIQDNAWLIKDKKEYWLEVNPEKTLVKLDLNLRITNEYKYSNLFILFRIYGPHKEMETKRLEFKLADTHGDWLGSGSGGIYTFRIPLTDSYTFSQKGVYKFEIEQDMRDNPLRGVVDIGLRIEKR